MRELLLFIVALCYSTLPAVAQSKGDDEKSLGRPMLATMGLETGAPTSQEIQQLKLDFNVRHRGQVIREVQPGGAADVAGLKVGDALIGIDRNDLYSQDDLHDFVATSKPGRKVRIRLKRSGSSQEETVVLQMGGRPMRKNEAASPTIQWDFSSLAQLPDALRQAKLQKKYLLVGISGAET